MNRPYEFRVACQVWPPDRHREGKPLMDVRVTIESIPTFSHALHPAPEPCGSEVGGFLLGICTK
jgi:hypothetical protein